MDSPAQAIDPDDQKVGTPDGVRARPGHNHHHHTPLPPYWQAARSERPSHGAQILHLQGAGGEPATLARAYSDTSRNILPVQGPQDRATSPGAALAFSAPATAGTTEDGGGHRRAVLTGSWSAMRRGSSHSSGRRRQAHPDAVDALVEEETTQKKTKLTKATLGMNHRCEGAGGRYKELGRWSCRSGSG